MQVVSSGKILLKVGPLRFSISKEDLTEDETIYGLHISQQMNLKTKLSSIIHSHVPTDMKYYQMPSTLRLL